MALGILFFLLAAGDLAGGVMLLRRHSWAAKWVFWVAVIAIVTECLDLSITRTGYLTLSKPLAWVTSILAICGVVSR